MVGKGSIRCAKCGISSKEDSSLKFHRFPLPSMHGSLKARVWAKFCFPNEDWDSDESLVKLQKQHKMICSNHFDDSAFTNSAKTRLNRFAIPTDAQNILAQFRDALPSNEAQKPQTSSLETSEMSDLLPVETISTPPPTSFCICCLQEEVPLINLLTCTHAEFLNSLMMPEINPNDQVVCYQCHEMLKKIKLFKLQVEESFKMLSDSREENTPKCNIQKQKLTIHRTFNIDIPETNKEDNLQTIDNTEESLAKSSQNKEKKSKYIEDALKVINGNQNNEYLNILTSSIRSISHSLITDLYSDFQLNKTGSIPSKLHNNTASSSTTAISNERVTKNNTRDKNLLDEIRIENVDQEIDSEEWHQQVTKIDNSIVESESDMQIDSTNAHFEDTPSLGSNLKQLTLTKEELIMERAKLASSPRYVRARHRCKSCLIGFQYKENLADHVKRKHTLQNKQSHLKCKVCRQFVRRDMYDMHTFWHYNRYKCLSCGQQFDSYDNATLHYTKQHSNISSGNTELKCPHCPYKTL